MGDLVDKTGSRYQLVNLVARRARNIASNAQETGDILNDKPVSIAIDEVYEGELSIRK